MFARAVKALSLACLLAIVVFAVKNVQSGAPFDLLKEWAYPKAKQGKEGTNQPPLVWARFTTTDAFEKVWEFYIKKVTPLGGQLATPPKVKSGTVYSGEPPDVTICAYFYDDNPMGKLGTFVIRKPKTTISVTILRREKAKETTILVAVDQR
ncbi:MAG: hypothetical protein NZ805_09300 [Armatimonadetes bacterium]|nr:hypothetical protein [Armatimonadota bacterium]